MVDLFSLTDLSAVGLAKADDRWSLTDLSAVGLAKADDRWSLTDLSAVALAKADDRWLTSKPQQGDFADIFSRRIRRWM